MTPRINTASDIAKGLAALALIEPRFAPLIARTGEVPLRRSEPGFAGLCRTIVSQQVSVASARAIWARVDGRYPALCHQDIRQASEADLRGCGLSGPKIRTLNAIADAVDDGRLDFAHLETATAAEVHASMTAVSGIGPWTADIYLMFHLGHADVFAPGDLALQEALKIGFGLDARPNAREFAAIAESWAPWRAVAARLLWAFYAKVKTRDGVGV
ncbi:MAG: DNA-3-methyladenine glycosylase family protein [Bosea sp. (in: a-proteobacteria)]